MIRLIDPGERFDASRERKRNRQLELALDARRRQDDDVELERGARLIMRSEDGTRWQVSVNNDGTLTTSQL